MKQSLRNGCINKTGTIAADLPIWKGDNLTGSTPKNYRQLRTAGRGRVSLSQEEDPHWLSSAGWSALKPYTQATETGSAGCKYTCVFTHAHV